MERCKTCSGAGQYMQVVRKERTISKRIGYVIPSGDQEWEVISEWKVCPSCDGKGTVPKK